MVRYETDGGIIETGRDSLEFVEELDGGWDCVVWDPPYYNPGTDMYSKLKKNGNSKMGDKYFMNKKKRITYKNEILKKVNSKYTIIYFHTNHANIPRDSKLVIYHKTWRPHNNVMGNYEFAYFNKLYNKIGWKTRVYPDNTYPPREMSKPVGLYKFLFELLGCKYVLDPFAGYGNSIRAAMDLGIKIDACDLDDTLDYSEFKDYTPKVKTEQTSIDTFL